MGKRVALGRSSSTNRREGSRVQRQSIANVVESKTMGQLREEQCEHVTPGCVGARVFLDASLSGQLRNQVFGNEVANLTQNRQLTSRWLLALVFFSMTVPVARYRPKANAFFRQIPLMLWDGCDFKAGPRMSPVRTTGNTHIELSRHTL